MLPIENNESLGDRGCIFSLDAVVRQMTEAWSCFMPFVLFQTRIFQSIGWADEFPSRSNADAWLKSGMRSSAGDRMLGHRCGSEASHGASCVQSRR